MLAVLAVIIFATVGTVFSDVALSDEFYKTVNTFLNLLTVVGGPWVIYRISVATRKHIDERIEPKVDKVIENTEHLCDWDHVTERRQGEDH